jgi:hypothetical protein
VADAPSRGAVSTLGAAVDFLAIAAGANGDRPSRLSTRLLLQAMFGLWVAERAGIHGAASACAAVARRVQATLSGASSSEWQGLDSRLLLLCHAAMQSHNAESPALERYAIDLAEMVIAIERLPPKLGLEAYLLVRVGAVSDHALRAARSEPPLDIPTQLMTMDRAAIQEETSAIAAASNLGGCRARLSDPEVASAVLASLLLQKLREYDLTLASELLRSMSYIGEADSDAVAHAVDFLFTQQQLDGRFGYYGRELRKSDAEASSDFAVYIPVTTSVAWALAEVCVPTFHLFADLSPRTGNVSSPAAARRDNGLLVDRYR